MTVIVTESFDVISGSSALINSYLGYKHGKFIPGIGGRVGSSFSGVALGVAAGRHLNAMYLLSLSATGSTASFVTVFDSTEEDDVIVLGLAINGQFCSTSGDGIFFSEYRNIAGALNRFDHVKFNPNTLSSTNGIMDVKNAAGTTVGSVTGVFISTWKYLEIKVKIHDTLGTIEVRIDGVTVLNLTGQDTRNNTAGTTGLINAIVINQTTQNATTTVYLDDLYVLNEQGASPCNDFIGDVTITYIQPNGVGSNTNWTPSASVPNWDTVNDALATAPIITDFVTTYATDSKDSYVVEDMPQVTPVRPLAVVNYALLDKTDTGPRTAALVTKLGANELQSADQLLRDNTNGGPSYCKQVLQTKPGGGVWTITDVNAMEIGAVCRP